MRSYRPVTQSWDRPVYVVVVYCCQTKQSYRLNETLRKEVAKEMARQAKRVYDTYTQPADGDSWVWTAEVWKNGKKRIWRKGPKDDG